MLIFNASRHTIQAIDAHDTYTLDYHGIESSCPQLLLDLYERHHYDQIVVINGPGAFTTLRVGCLSVNMLLHVYPQIRLYQISKLGALAVLRDARCLPSDGYMYIGQTKYLWKFSGQQRQKVGLDECLSSLSLRDECRYDEGVSDMLPVGIALPLDHTVSVGLSGEGLTVSYGKTVCQVSPGQLEEYRVQTITPDYMIQPTGV